ncbi:MAG: DMT family transporter [bacterium]
MNVSLNPGYVSYQQYGESLDIFEKNRQIFIPLITSLLFAGSFIAGKYTTRDLGPLTTSLLRYLVAFIFLSILLYLNNSFSLKVELVDILTLIILGLFGIVGYHYFFFSSLRFTEVANTAIINALSPIVTGVVAAIFIKERLTIRNYIGVNIVVIGVILLIIKGKISNLIGLNLNLGDSLMLCAVLSWVIYSLLIKKLSNKYSSFTLTFYATLFGVLLLLIFALTEDCFRQIKEISIVSFCSVLYMGIAASGIGYLFYNLSIARIGPTKTSGFISSLVPIFVALLAWLFFSEPITLIMVLSIAFVLYGLNMMFRKQNSV